MGWSLSLLLLALASLGGGAPLNIMSAPNLLRVGTPENIFVECQGCHGDDIPVTISVWNHPTKSIQLESTTVVLSGNTHYQAFGEITLPSSSFHADPTVKQYVYLTAQFGGHELLQKVVLVTFQSGHIFIQTDKPLYTPGSRVLFRMFAVTPQMKPVEGSVGGERGTSITIDVETPDGIVLPQSAIMLRSGIHTGGYTLPHLLSPGGWRLVARFQTNPQQSFHCRFEVKEYVLPSMEVTLEPMVPFFHVDSTEFTVTIKARYFIREAVDGTAYVVFGAIAQGRRTTFTGSHQRVPVHGVPVVEIRCSVEFLRNSTTQDCSTIHRGVGEVTLRRDHITDTFPHIHQLVGELMFVSVSVLTNSGSEIVEAELTDIKIVKSPYSIQFTQTPKYFKPGMTFEVTVKVTHPDDTPAPGIHVMVNPGQEERISDEDGIVSLAVRTGAVDDRLDITARTVEPSLSPETQASAHFTASSYVTKSRSYIHIGVDSYKLNVGRILKIFLFLNKPINKDLTYLVLSKGQLVYYGREKIQGQVLIPLNIRVTKEMLPSFRVVAYYHLDTEVVSDSVRVDVKDSCMGSLTLEDVDPPPSYRPGKLFELKVTGDPGAKVGLVAVDKGVYVLNKQFQLTQKKVWEEVEKFDPGCTPGGGKDSMGVFSDAGLVFETSSGPGTPLRLELKCAESENPRRKRDVTAMGVTTRTDYSYIDSRMIETRSHFQESWLWRDVSLPSCPTHTSHCQTTSSTKMFHLPDSLSTWVLTGISMSSTNGICVSRPLELNVRKEFFIDLQLPYSAVRYEQLEMKAVLHNYARDPVTVRVELVENPKVCSLASKHGKHYEEVTLGARTSRSVPFIIIPTEIGELEVVVKASVRESTIHDGVRKHLRVVSEGVLVRHMTAIHLDPVNKGKDGVQTVVFNSEIPKADLVPFSPHKVLISVTGTDDVSHILENVFSGKPMGTLIVQPAGSGEENMISMSLPVIAARYLDATKQWEAVGLQRREEALRHVTTGYKNQLKFRNLDGSYSVFASHPKSSWLTAYVVKVFSMASNLVNIRPEHICDGVKFLILQSQLPDGTFREIGTVLHNEMMGALRGVDSDASMTAFSLIALQESKPICSSSIPLLQGSIDRSVAYLERRLPGLTNPYAVALASYALANNNKLNREVLLTFISPELNRWPVPGGTLPTLEATAYALLALVRAKAFADAGPVVRWLSSQQAALGGSGSTQATMMVYQAVAEYWTNAIEQEYDLNVGIQLEGTSRPTTYNFNKKNHFTTRTMNVKNLFDNITVTASGTGRATVKMVSVYYGRPGKAHSHCDRFNVSVQLIPVTDNDDSEYKLKIEVQYLDLFQDSTMTILDIGLLTGFTANTRDLDLLSTGRDRTIARYEMDKVLSERGSLIIYLDKVSHTLPEEISFRIHKRINVALLQPAAVSVYEYYSSQYMKCVKFYHPERHSGELLLLTTGELTTCAEEGCGMQKKGNVNDGERVDKLCDTALIDFAYKVKVVETDQREVTDVSMMRIIHVIKGGTIDPNPADQQRPFVSYIRCRNALNLQKEKTYLIMGSKQDVFRSGATQQYQYVLGAGTWIEYWPTAEECQDPYYRPTCLGLENMMSVTDDFPCHH